jgi:hypothetical protein
MGLENWLKEVIELEPGLMTEIRRLGEHWEGHKSEIDMRYSEIQRKSLMNFGVLENKLRQKEEKSSRDSNRRGLLATFFVLLFFGFIGELWYVITRPFKIAGRTRVWGNAKPQSNPRQII